MKEVKADNRRLTCGGRKSVPDGKVVGVMYAKPCHTCHGTGKVPDCKDAGPKPLSTCEGCADKECGIRGRYRGDRRLICYREGNSCEGCADFHGTCDKWMTITRGKNATGHLPCYREGN